MGSGAGAATHSSARQHGRFGAEVEEHGGDVDAGDAVGEGVVRLVHEADVLAVVDTLDEPQLPQRSATVEHLHREPLGELAQLAPGSRCGQRGDAHVIGDVEALVVDPHRPALPERHRHDPLAEAGDELQAGSDEGPHLVEAEPTPRVVERLAFEHRHRADVHRRLGALQVEEALVEPGEPVVHRGRCHQAERTRSVVISGPRHDVIPRARTSTCARPRRSEAFSP